jgi:polar amino acid transport system substrate-binding protein
MSTRFARGALAAVMLAAVVLAAVVLAATAGDQWSGHPALAAVTEQHTPTAVAPPAAALSPGPALATSDCTPQNRRASLRPQGPLPAPGQMPAGSTMARIAQRGYLIAGANQDVQGFTFRDENLRLQGFEIDIARDIAEAIFGDRERVVFRQPNVAGRLEITKSGEVDLVVAGMTITCQRREEVDFSTAYLETGQRVLVNRGSGFTDLASLTGHPVCASRGSTGLETIQAATLKLIPVSVSTHTDCLALLQLGKVDAACATDATLATMAAQDPRTEIVGPQLTEEPFGVAINKDTPDLLRFVNAVLERRAQDGRWRASYERWLTLLGPPPPPPTPQYQA